MRPSGGVGTLWGSPPWGGRGLDVFSRFRVDRLRESGRPAEPPLARLDRVAFRGGIPVV